MKNMYILGIESSCDETSASIVMNGTKEIATVISSQIDVHKSYGGVVPEIASREHVKNITIVLEECLQKNKTEISKAAKQTAKQFHYPNQVKIILDKFINKYSYKI